MFALGLAWTLLRAHAGAPTDGMDDDWHRGVRMLARDGRVLRQLPSSVGGGGVELELGALGHRIVRATIMCEDKRFFAHDGIDELALVRAVVQAVFELRVVSGASTITQQLVKLIDAGGAPRPRDVLDKLIEAARARNLEDSSSKHDILGGYLNRLSYGHGILGPEAAARAYFGVSARHLSWAQAAFLAVLPRAPSRLDPYRHRDRALARQRTLLAALLRSGDLDMETYTRALAEPIEPIPLVRPFFAPHLSEWLRNDVNEPLDEATVQTTIDLTLQRDVEGLVRTHMDTLGGLGAHDAAVLVVDNRTGEVLVYVGSVDFYEPRWGQVDMVRARRQPGSTLKPFVYAAWFALGHGSPDLLADVPLQHVEATGTGYAPENFDRSFVGPVSARVALAQSLNVPAVRVANELGPARVLELLRTFGFVLERPAEHYGLALALGSGEVSLWELAHAYVTLARLGEHVALRVRASSTMTAGSALGSEATGIRQVIAPDIAASVVEILADPTARVGLLHGRVPFDFGFPVAIKTGTSSGHRDAFTIGFTHERTVAVWVGNADGTGMHGLTGANAAGPLFADVMRRAMQDVTRRQSLWEDQLLDVREVCSLSGHAPTSACPEIVTRHIAHSAPPPVPCTVHVRATPDRAGGASGRWRCSSRGRPVVRLLPVFSDWLATHDREQVDAHGLPWLSHVDVTGCDGSGSDIATLTITSPPDGVLIELGSRPSDSVVVLKAAFERTSLPGHGVDLVDFVLDGRVVARSGAPFRAVIPATPGRHEVFARPADPEIPAACPSRTFRVQ